MLTVNTMPSFVDTKNNEIKKKNTKIVVIKKSLSYHVQASMHCSLQVLVSPGGYLYDLLKEKKKVFLIVAIYKVHVANCDIFSSDYFHARNRFCVLYLFFYVH